METKENIQIYVRDRKFGFIEVLWQISNYFPATCKKGWVLYSPEFSVRGHQLTKWRLFMKDNKKLKHSVSTYLERLDSDPFPGAVRVKWRLIYSCLGCDGLISYMKGVFERKSSIPTKIEDIEQLESELQSSSSNTFVVRCVMIVYGLDSRRFQRSKDVGLKSLSQDLAVLHRLKKGFDVMLDINGTLLSAHKAILCARNEILKREIERNCENHVIELELMDIEATTGIIAYLYTGNLEYVLRCPSIEILEFAEFFDIKEVSSYYFQDQVTIQTEFGVKKFNFEWWIPKIESTGNYLQSPCYNLRSMNMSLRLNIHRNEVEHMKYLDIFAEIAGGIKPQEIYLQISMTDVGYKSGITKSKRWSTEEGDKLGFENFVLVDILNTLKINGKLRVTCTLQIPTGSKSLSVFGSKTGCLTSTKSEEHYDALSKDITSLFETGKYSDFTIVSGEKNFKVHKFILSTRSHVFDRILSIEGNENSVTISDVSPNILHIVLHYMYSGSLGNYKIPDILKIYEAAEKFFILPLKYTCSRILQGSLEHENILEILFAADKNKDLKLKASAIKYICCDMEPIHKKKIWGTVVNESESLSKDLFLCMETSYSTKLKTST